MGQRRNEIAELRWHEVDLDRAVITLAGARTKNGRPHTIPLAATAREILTARWERRDPDRALVFGIGQGGFSGWADCKRQLDDEVKLPPWVIHDLQRSVATGMNEIGIPPWVVEAVLNHASGHRAGVAGVYNRAVYETEKTTALARWDEHLMAAVEGRESNVATLRR
jgi:integrase